MTYRSSLAALLLLCCAGLAQAQFVWIGPNGTRQYSDQPPPPGTPPSKILKMPGRPAPAQEAPTAAPASDTVKPKAAPTLAEREADYRKRVKAREEADAKSQSDARSSAAHAEHCDSVRANARMYASGMRISEIGADGQRRFVSDAERAAGNARTEQKLRECR